MDMSNRRIVIVGKTGVGKSSLANTIFEEKLVKIGHNISSDTKKCQAVTKPVNGRNITLIDTPGLFDTHRSEEELKTEIVSSIIECAPGPHAFLILLKVERYTEQEEAIIIKIDQYFSEEVFKYATVLFTHGDQLEEEQTIEDFFHDNETVNNLVKKCGGRCHVIDNKYWKNNQQEEYRSNQFQVKELLNTIDEMVEANKGRCYMSNRRIIILGKTGAGKSSLANTIFGEKVVKVGNTVKSDTKKCQSVTKPVNGRNITLIDTPGLFDTHRSEKELKSEIVSSITECAPGVHAFLILLKVERYTEHEHAVITRLIQYFSEEVLKYATVLFTHGDQLEEEQTINEFICDHELLEDLMKKCGGRCHVVDNKHWKNNQQEEYRNNQFQVKELLNTIDEMVEANKGRCYTNEMLQEVDKKIKEEMQLIRQSAGNKSEEEIREEAKERVSESLGVKLARIATDALLKSFFGVVVMVKVVLLALEAGVTLVKSAASGATAAGGAVETSSIACKLASSVVGTVTGAVAGYHAAEGADTLLEAAKRAAKVVMDGSQTTVDAVKHHLRK